jgi:hypothetical protein
MPPSKLLLDRGHLRLGVTERYAEYDTAYLKEVASVIELDSCGTASR